MTLAMDHPVTQNSWSTKPWAARTSVTQLTRNQDDPKHRQWRESGTAGQARASRWVLLQSALAQLERLQALPHDWDSYGGEPVDAGAADLMVMILNLLVEDDGPTPQVTAMGDGGVQVEWRVNDAMVEVEVSADRLLRFYLREQDGAVELDDEDVPLQVARTYLLQVRQCLEAMGRDVKHRRPQ